MIIQDLKPLKPIFFFIQSIIPKDAVNSNVLDILWRNDIVAEKSDWIEEKDLEHIINFSSGNYNRYCFNLKTELDEESIYDLFIYSDVEWYNALITIGDDERHNIRIPFIYTLKRENSPELTCYVKGKNLWVLERI